MLSNFEIDTIFDAAKGGAIEIAEHMGVFRHQVKNIPIVKTLSKISFQKKYLSQGCLI